MRCLLLFITLSVFSCKDLKLTDENKVLNVSKIEKELIKESRFPNTLQEIFMAHGGYKNWLNFKTLRFSIFSQKNSETHTIDLKSRKEIVKSEHFTRGFDGQTYWLDLHKPNSFKLSSVRFYNNLYFYFYAMPFIIGDPGISYEEINALLINGKSYSGYKITFKSNVGESPNDNYFLYYDQKTKQMTWLGYTVTYGKGTPSNDIHYIHYESWQMINGLKLPKAIRWYTSKDNLPHEPSNRLEFIDVELMTQTLDLSYFEKTETAIEAN